MWMADNGESRLKQTIQGFLCREQGGVVLGEGERRQKWVV
jgi:hypothetical protein